MLMSKPLWSGSARSAGRWRKEYLKQRCGSIPPTLNLVVLPSENDIHGFWNLYAEGGRSR